MKYTVLKLVLHAKWELTEYVCPPAVIEWLPLRDFSKTDQETLLSIFRSKAGGKSLVIPFGERLS